MKRRIILEISLAIRGRYPLARDIFSAQISYPTRAVAWKENAAYMKIRQNEGK
jgi:hypothetical protein